MSTRRPFTRRFASRALASALVLAAPLRAADEPAAPSPQPVRLVWTRALGAEACPEASVIEADVTARLGNNPFRSDATSAIDVRVGRERGEWSALIEDRPDGGAPTGSRIVTSAAESCDSLALAVGLAVALMIRERATSEPAAPPPPVPVAPPPSAPPLAPPKAPETPDSRHVATAVSAVLALGVLPEPAFGASVAGRVPAGEHVAFRAALVFLPEQRSNEPSGAYAFGATFGELAGCYQASPAERVRLGLCAAGLLGALHVVVTDPAPLEPGARVLGAGALGLDADFSLVDPLHLFLGIDGMMRFVRHAYVVELGETTETVFTEPRFAALFRAGIGVEL